jgi:hypothetical protein
MYLQSCRILTRLEHYSNRIHYRYSDSNGLLNVAYIVEQNYAIAMIHTFSVVAAVQIYFVDLTIARVFILKEDKDNLPSFSKVYTFVHSFPQFYKPNELTFVEDN